ncbi:MAG: 50S ribosomal protein L22 [Candidatus Spechtbacteria bacterium RIFCSPLOWO2_02_FULL_38_8]|uniref:Large ribosomal subunit protein uL22 n=1 Tax=Candidatus Spechtbacteria bacterium RIFCSPLOWO2_02_FULL_38_8 TaxID=1802164 RepID=A0A1G2HGF8_9BACT|nr:MAG: 50S ribosomal protein L22 [Candidatus Spechtbacteria bacterium RIFCSPLOWO2_02_FULL_38_8]
MEYKATLSYLKIAPRKVRLVVDLVRGKKLEDARHQLQFSKQRSAVSILKLLNSAFSNAKNTKENLDTNMLFVKEIFVDEGPKLKRFRARARGSAYGIQKKTSHVTLVLSEKEPKKSETRSTKSETNLEIQKEKTKTKKL